MFEIFRSSVARRRSPASYDLQVLAQLFAEIMDRKISVASYFGAAESGPNVTAIAILTRNRWAFSHPAGDRLPLNACNIDQMPALC
jgi:hypothetical protein